MIKRESDEKKQQEFWKECGFDMNEEFKIYRFLCGNMSKRERKNGNAKRGFIVIGSGVHMWKRNCGI